MAIVALFTTEKMDRAQFEAVHARMVATVGPYPKGRRLSLCFGEEGRLKVLDEMGVWLAGPPEIAPLVSARILGQVAALAAHAAFSAGDHDAAMGLVAPDVRFVDHGRNICCATRDEFRGWLDSHKQMSSDMRIVDARYIPGGEWVTAQFRVEGSNDGPCGPLPATGRPFSLDICEVWRFDESGAAVEGHNYSDGRSLMAQLDH